MKLRYFTLVFLFCIEFSISQISPSDSKKITKILGKNFIELTPQKSYPYSSLNPNVFADTSLIIQGDTTGIFFNNEYLLFRSAIHFTEGFEVKKMMRANYVTVAEYQEFQNYVRDSVAREWIYVGLQNDIHAAEYIQYTKKYWDVNKQKMLNFDPSDRMQNRLKFPLNWNKKLDYYEMKNKEIMPLLAEFYLPSPDRFYNSRDFDERSFCYNYRYLEKYPSLNQVTFDSILKLFPVLVRKVFSIKGKIFQFEQFIPTITDPYVWSIYSDFERDESSVLTQVYLKTLKNQPILGINGVQARAFCHWKQEQLQKSLDSKNINAKVIISLPSFEDVANLSQLSFRIPEKNYTSLWQITNGEYTDFIAAVKDSILRENIYRTISSDKTALNLLKAKTPYFNDGSLDVFDEIDITQRNYNRFMFPFNLKRTINLNKPEINQIYSTFQFNRSYTHPKFKYFYIDSKARSTNIEYIPMKQSNDWYEKTSNDFNWISYKAIDYESIYAKNCYNTSFNDLFQETGVRYHCRCKYEQFIKQVETPILPDSTSTETEIIKKITYEQALAFYHWKYPIQKIKPTDNWQDYVLPTKEQFEKIRLGEQIIVEEKKVEFPSPVFRYVVHIYPKTN